MVAILSLGAQREFPLGRRGGGGRCAEVGHGDLLVMGGDCQRSWEHAVPKTEGRRAADQRAVPSARGALILLLGPRPAAVTGRSYR